MRAYIKVYDYRIGELSETVSAASFMPYFAGVADEKQKSGLLNLLRMLESDWGIFATEITGQKISVGVSEYLGAVSVYSGGRFAPLRI